MIGLALTFTVAGCNQLVGFKDVKLEGDGGTGPGSDGQMQMDAPVDMAIDGPPPKLFAFATDASFIGGFGAAAGARTTADIKCQDKYNMSFSTLGCAAGNIHAFIQIDDTVDSIARMKITFPIPLTVNVKRATDLTPVANTWDAFADPSTQLLAPIVQQAGAIRFWSGRSGGTNLSCNHWVASTAGTFGNTGDATKVTNWTSLANIDCSDFDQHLVCICF